MPTIDQTELGFLYPIETVILETENREPEIKTQPEMEKSMGPEAKKPEMKKSSETEKSLEMKKSPESDIKNPETDNLLPEMEISAEPETKKPEMPKQRPSTLSYSQPMNTPVIVCSSASLEQIIVQVSFSWITYSIW